MTVLLSCKARNKDQVSVAVSVQVCVSMREVDKKAIGDAIGAVIKSIRAVGGGDDSEVSRFDYSANEHVDDPCASCHVTNTAQQCIRCMVSRTV